MDKATEYVMFVHVLSAVLLGFYLFVPWLLLRLGKQSAAVQEGTVRTVSLLNRIGQYVLVLAFLSGGYLVSKYNSSGVWMILAIVLILVMFALSGIMSKPLKRIGEAVANGREASEDLRLAQVLGTVNALVFLLILIIMNFPTI